MTTFNLVADTSGIDPTIRYLLRFSRRSALAPQTRRRLLHVLKAAPGAIKTTTVNLDTSAVAGTRKACIRLEFRQAFLRRVAALRAFDIDAVGGRKIAQGGSFSC